MQLYGLRNPQHKIVTIESAVDQAAAIRARGGSVCVVNGCFDLLHRGHAGYLWQARRQADALFVLVNSDASVRALKGPSRPIIDERDRLYMVAALACTTAVVMFDGERCAAELAALRPDVYCISEERRDTQDPSEAAALSACRATTIYIPRPDGSASTSAIVRRIAELERPDSGRMEVASA